MQEEKISSIRSGLETAYINGNVASELSYKPNFVSNNYSEGKKVLSVIEDELLKCDRFQISVAFITLGGVTPLLQTLKELEQKGIPGEVLTSNYLDFSEPLALKKLHSLSNIQIKMYDTKAAHNGFHTKGYIFKEEEVYRHYYWQFEYDKCCPYNESGMEYKVSIYDSGRNGRRYSKGI